MTMETRDCGCVVPETIYCAHTPTPKQIDEVAMTIAHYEGKGWSDYRRQAEAVWPIIAAALAPLRDEVTTVTRVERDGDVDAYPQGATDG